MANKNKKTDKAPVQAKKPAQETAVVVNKKADVAKNNDKKVAAKNKNGKPKKTAKEFFLGIKTGFKSILSELKKVTWPKFGTAAKNTGIVLGVVFIFLVVCLGIDLGLTGIFNAIIG